MTNKDPHHMDQYDYVDEDYFYEAIDEYSPLIGSFLMNFSLLERELNIAIAEFINDGTHEIGYVVVGQLSMERKIEIFYKFYLQMETSVDGKNKVRLEKIKRSLLELNSFRNQIAHADWGTLNKKHGVRIKIQTDNETGLVKFKLANILPKDIEGKIESIDETIEELDSYKELACSC